VSAGVARADEAAKWIPAGQRQVRMNGETTERNLHVVVWARCLPLQFSVVFNDFTCRWSFTSPCDWSQALLPQLPVPRAIDTHAVMLQIQQSVIRLMMSAIDRRDWNRCTAASEDDWTTLNRNWFLIFTTFCAGESATRIRLNGCSFLQK